jgi:branched-chain amino acid transport system permease protein
VPIAEWHALNDRRPTLKLRGHYLAMATLGLGLIVSIVLNTEDRVTGGPDGMAVPPLALFGTIVQGERSWYWISGGALLLAVWVARNLIDSPTGRALGAETAMTIGVKHAPKPRPVIRRSRRGRSRTTGVHRGRGSFMHSANSSWRHSAALTFGAGPRC